jgi:hypothetical protein
MADVKLKIVPKPEPKTRVLLTLNAKTGPILQGKAKDAPRFCCGACGALLIDGIYANQFVDGTQDIYVGSETWRPVALTPEEHVISKPLRIIDELQTTITMTGPFLLTCYQCRSVNEMFAPNVLGPSQ